MSSLFFSSSFSPLSIALRRSTLCRFSSIVTYATEEEKSRFIHPTSVVHPNALLGDGPIGNNLSNSYEVVVWTAYILPSPDPTLWEYTGAVHDATEEEKLVDIIDEKSRFIHPTSVVHPNAILGDGVSIGPFCTIGPFAKLGSTCQLYPGSHIFGNTELGDNCILMTGAVIGDDLPGHTVVGRNNVFGHHAVIGVKCQDMKYKFGNECFLEIGDNNEIREHVSIHRSSSPTDKTVIGDNNLIMGSCHIAHDCKVGNNNILANSTLLAGHVVVEDYAHTAGGIVVHQFCCIGSYSFIGGGSVVSQDVPKYIIVSGERAELRGLNLEGLRRRGFSATEIKSLRAAYRKIFMPTDMSSGNIEDRLAQVEQHKELGLFPAVCSMVQSIRDSFAEHRRGICKFRSWSGS